MLQNNYYYKSNLRSNIVEHLKNKIAQSRHTDWQEHLEMEILLLTEKDFIDDPKIFHLVKKFNARCGIFRYRPNFCYGWHYDLKRNTSLNMQIQGGESYCLFGEMIALRKFQNIEKLIYEDHYYYLLNVKNWHSVLNFQLPRYVLTIGFPKPILFEDIRLTLIENNL